MDSRVQDVKQGKGGALEPPLRVGIVGGGKGSDEFIRVLMRIPQVVVVGLCEADPEQPACRRARKHGIPIHGNCDNLLAENTIDWLILLSANFADMKNLTAGAIIIDSRAARTLLGMLLALEDGGKGKRKEADRRLLAAWPMVREMVAWLPPAGEMDGMRDVETGLFHPRALYSLMQKEMHRSARHNQPLSLLMVGIDRWERIGPGRGVGREVGRLLNEVHRTSDLLSRVDEDAFAVLLPNTTQSQAQTCAERLKGLINRRVTSFDGEPVTVSAGLVTFKPGPGHPSSRETLTVDRLYHYASQAMQCAREKGGHRVAAFPKDCFAV